MATKEIAIEAAKKYAEDYDPSVPLMVTVTGGNDYGFDEISDFSDDRGFGGQFVGVLLPDGRYIDFEAPAATPPPAPAPTLRDRYIMAALTGLCANPEVLANAPDAIRLADAAMLAARSTPTPE